MVAETRSVDHATLVRLLSHDDKDAVGALLNLLQAAIGADSLYFQMIGTGFAETVAATAEEALPLHDWSQAVDGGGEIQFIDHEQRQFICAPVRVLDGLPIGILFISGNTDHCDETGLEHAIGNAAKQLAALLEARLSNIQLEEDNVRLVGITQSQRTRLARERQINRIILNNTTEGVLALDTAGQLISINRAAIEIIFRSSEVDKWIDADPSKIPAKALADFYHLYQMDGVTPLVRAEIPVARALNGEQFTDCRVCIKPPGKDTRYVQASGSPLTIAGQLVGGVVVIKDITQSLLDERELLRRHELLLESEQIAKVGSFELDLDTQTMWWSDELYRISGLDDAEFTPDVKGTAARLHPDDRDQVVQEITLAVTRGDAFQREARVQFGAGDYRQFRLRGHVKPAAEGLPRRLVGVCQDITESEEMARQLRDAQRFEAIGTLASGVAHDLNNILAPILLSTPLLEEHLPAELGIAQTLDVSARRGAELVRQLLTFAKGGAGNRQPLNLANVIRDVETIVVGSFSKLIHIEWEIADDIPDILGDPSQIHQVILNLCVNARDAMPEGGELHVSVLKEAVVQDDGIVNSGEYARISIADNGEGIPEHVVTRIFDPFFSTKPIGSGTGLGLSMTRSIIKNHGGFIRVETEEGAGTCFHVYIPAISEVELEKDESDQITFQGNGQTVLVVDDEVTIRSVAKAVLESMGLQVITAVDGLDALEKLREHYEIIDIVITHINMPKMSGVDFSLELRRLLPAVPLIVASGYFEDEAMARLRVAGVSHFISKPFNKAQLASVLSQELSMG